MKIELSAPQASLLLSACERNLFLGGQGIGKTHLMGLISELLVNLAPKALGMIAANTYGQLSESTLFRIFQVWQDHMGWTEYTKQNPGGFYVVDKEPPPHFIKHGYKFKSNANKIFFANGAVVMLASLDNYKAIDGREICWALLDETKDTRMDALKDVILARTRQKRLTVSKNKLKNREPMPFLPYNKDKTKQFINPVYIFTSPSKEPWLSEMFDLQSQKREIEECIFSETDYYCKRDYENNRCVVIASTYHNAKNLPENYIKNRKADLSKDRIDMLVYGSPFGKIGNEYYANFNRDKHVKQVEFTDDLPFHISFDFNVNPYMTLVVSQLVQEGERWHLNIIDEYTLEAPKNSIGATCQAFLDDWEHLCYAGVYFYGDASGKNSLPLEDVKNYYSEVEKYLSPVLQGDSKRLLRANPRHKSIGNKTLGRRDFMNKFLAGKYGVDLHINPRCKKTILDFEHIREDANGAKLKKKEVINGVSCERYGHTSDAVDGIVTYLWGDWNRD